MSDEDLSLLSALNDNNKISTAGRRYCEICAQRVSGMLSYIYVTASNTLVAKVVLATCHSSGSRQLFNEEFDVVIIDEATQALEAVSLE